MNQQPQINNTKQSVAENTVSPSQGSRERIRIEMQERAQRMRNLPKPLQDYIWSGQVRRSFQSVVSKQQIYDGKLKSIASKLVGQVLIGELHPNSFIRRLAEGGGVDIERSRTIARSVSAQVFSPVRNELLKVYQINERTKSEATIPAVPKQATIVKTPIIPETKVPTPTIPQKPTAAPIEQKRPVAPTVPKVPTNAVPAPTTAGPNVASVQKVGSTRLTGNVVERVIEKVVEKPAPKKSPGEHDYGHDHGSMPTPHIVIQPITGRAAAPQTPTAPTNAPAKRKGKGGAATQSAAGTVLSSPQPSSGTIVGGGPQKSVSVPGSSKQSSAGQTVVQGSTAQSSTAQSSTVLDTSSAKKGKKNKKGKKGSPQESGTYISGGPRQTTGGTQPTAQGGANNSAKASSQSAASAPQAPMYVFSNPQGQGGESPVVENIPEGEDIDKALEKLHGHGEGPQDKEAPKLKLSPEMIKADKESLGKTVRFSSIKDAAQKLREKDASLKAVDDDHRGLEKKSKTIQLEQLPPAQSGYQKYDPSIKRRGPVLSPKELLAAEEVVAKDDGGRRRRFWSFGRRKKFAGPASTAQEQPISVAIPAQPKKEALNGNTLNLRNPNR